ncbi:MAG: metallophosphoesterase [Tissierellia bacterium]|nr:metallophosphoesterase [Tissierellia bacterium]
MIYAISDLHLDHTKEKDMKIFGDGWQDYEEKIFKFWDIVDQDDLVLIAGDISWAMKIEDAKIDLDRIDSLKGKKIILKGNHDYWWTSLNKIRALGFESIEFLQNDALVFNNTRICGTRGWISRDDKDFTDHDEKVFKRELMRLELSLKYKLDQQYDQTIVMMHYPPFDRELKANEFEELFKKYGVDKVVYGHIHGKFANFMPEGLINGIEYYCTSADKLGFKPILIRK